ncbi:MAG: hypothetical protein K6G75_10645 [Lachnospiraceae bacterium]|nr:hypothetical protein [Lachnospiraceae bacterium]
MNFEGFTQDIIKIRDGKVNGTEVEVFGKKILRYAFEYAGFLGEIK